MSKDDHYYDSARAKVDKTDFASMRMPLGTARRSAPGGGGGVLRLLVLGIVLVVVLAVAKRYLF